MIPRSVPSRRDFLKISLIGSAAVIAGQRLSGVGAETVSAPRGATARVALMHGEDRAAIAFNALQPFADDVRKAIGNRRVVIKPNNVSTDVQLCATHAGCLEGILEFLKSIGKTDNIVIAESAANGPTFEGFENYKYTNLANRYRVKLVDLDRDAVEVVHVFDEKDFRPHGVRMSKLLLDPGSYVISAAKLKTHDRIVATLSLKNIVFGAPIKDAGFRWGKNRTPGAQNDKPIAHGSGFRAINYNLFDLARRLGPDLAVIDGYDGMEGNGPVGGTLVEHRVCIASTDWLAADRLGVELMGIDFAKVGYLNYCWKGGLGEADLGKIEVLGARVADHIRPYRLSTNIEKQLVWLQPPQPV